MISSESGRVVLPLGVYSLLHDYHNVHNCSKILFCGATVYLHYYEILEHTILSTDCTGVCIRLIIVYYEV